jgi:ABC-2 type transport system permease protein
MLHYLRLWRRFYIMAFVRATEYRFNFVVSVLEGLAQLGLAVASLLLLYQFVPSVSGWSQSETLMLAGIFRAAESVIALQLAPNIPAISGYVRRGDLDFILLRPVGSQFLVSLRWIWPSEVVNALCGLALAVGAGAAAGVRWDVGALALAAAFALCGLATLYAIWFASAALSLWLVHSSLDDMFGSLFDTARYPVTFFRGLARTLLTFAFPVAFVTTFPAEALLHRADWRLLPVGAALAAAGMVGSHLLWRRGLRSYGSASS